MAREVATMKRKLRKFQVKARRLLQLYSLWQETRRDEIQRKCLGLLKEIQAIDPRYNIRQEFRDAF